MNYLFDTNIVLTYLRNQQTKTRIEDTHHPLDAPNIPIISVVSIGELRSFTLQRNWGIPRIRALNEFLQQFVIADINAGNVIERYAEIDAFSQGKLKNQPLEVSARNMGKNDLWIAATASIINAKLLTTDADFDHLNGNFLEVIRIEIIKK
ncbi:MAG: PIN domain-containing protein [Saprospiraceae bacterium]|nr:PIN domain-containing protein [Saprospiraceae bacterium]